MLHAAHLEASRAIRVKHSSHRVHFARRLGSFRPAAHKPAPGEYATVNLPALSQDAVKGLPSDAYGVKREEVAYIWTPTKPQSSNGKHIAVIFAHGFSQGPTNYETLFSKFTELGWLVMAPTTTFDRFLWPWQRVETTGFCASLQEKLQTALVLDVLRTYQYLLQSSDWQVDEVLMCGHSMGGASAILAGAYLQKVVAAVGVMAPAVKQTVKSAINPFLHFDGSRDVNPDKYRKDITEFFHTKLLVDVDLHLLGAQGDWIVPPEQVEDVYLAAVTGRGDDAKGQKLPKASAWYRIPGGGHIGFEDNVNLDFTLPGILGLYQKVLFIIINILIYQSDLLKFLFPSKQFLMEKEVTHGIMVDAFAQSLGEKMVGKLEWGVSDVAQVVPPPPPYRLTPGQPTPQLLAAVPMAGPAEPGQQPIAQTGTLSIYAAAQTVTCVTAVYLLLKSLQEGNPASTSIGLGIMALLSAGFAWENLILAAGRFVTKDGTANLGTLQKLNTPRFFFHSLDPLLSVAGISIASRAGVPWASSPSFAVLSAAVLGLALLSSLLQNSVLLRTEPRWQNGILHYTYLPNPGLDFVRVVPVTATCLILTALGWAAYQADPGLWPFPAGAAACLVLASGLLPSRTFPMILAGNLGEALLLGGMIVAQARLF